MPLFHNEQFQTLPLTEAFPAFIYPCGFSMNHICPFANEESRTEHYIQSIGKTDLYCSMMIFALFSILFLIIPNICRFALSTAIEQ